MDNMDDSEKNAKISDSGYSNSCSNSQSRRSRSSKSTHSGSNSSGSSGYGGNPLTSGSRTILSQPPKKENESQKKSVAEMPCDEPMKMAAPEPILAAPKEEPHNVVDSTLALSMPEKVVENMDISTSDMASVNEDHSNVVVNYVTSRPITISSTDGFSCVISMHDGVVMYTTTSLSAALGYPKEMWIGRSFIDFVHPNDRITFASQITNGLALPSVGNGTVKKVGIHPIIGSTMVCRIRRYRGLCNGFGVRDRVVTFMPYLLKFSFKDITDEVGKIIYLVIQATLFSSAFKVPNEIVSKPVPFIIRHAANGILEYIDPESVPYLGHLPQDVRAQDALLLYHPEDLPYLRQVYESIVKQGTVGRSKPYRMMAQNGDYVTLETEWSSFINPWSMKLEFVIGKHYILEGPANPDVFQSPEAKPKTTDEDNTKIKQNRESILRVMNEVLTKPAEFAKLQMSKRCQDLASFIETLIEDTPKAEDELRLEIQDADNSYYERDSVMLGGISPHHDHDSKSSIDTPLSYNQLNYNVNLQRYFDSQELIESTDTDEDGPEARKSQTFPANFVSSVDQNSDEFKEMEFTYQVEKEPSPIARINSPVAAGTYPNSKLTENLLTRHNVDMERELVKIHRETRSSKGDRDRASNETRKKKKEHLARCNASFQPTPVGPTLIEDEVPTQGVKRGLTHDDSDVTTSKQHCAVPHSQRRVPTTADLANMTTTVATRNEWPPAANPVGHMNNYLLGVGMPQPMSSMEHVPRMSGVPPIHGMTVQGMPMAGMPMTSIPMPGISVQGMPMQGIPVQSMPMQGMPIHGITPVPGMPLPCVMYGQHMYGQPFMYSPLNPMYPIHQSVMQYTNTMHPLGLTNSNYEEACKPGLPIRPTQSAGAWKQKTRASSLSSRSQSNQASGVSSTKNKRNAEVPTVSASQCGKSKYTEETVDKTDGESSYSSFYSSFFRTEAGSTEESSDPKRKASDVNNKFTRAPGHYYDTPLDKSVRRKADAPWMEQVSVSSELIYKYQVLTKSMDEVLKADKKKIDAMEQPSLVNEQLGQLYLDLQLEGVAARLTLEEGLTSSSSSGEENTQSVKGKRVREYSKLMMIYEEDAPMPPPPAPVDAVPKVAKALPSKHFLNVPKANFSTQPLEPSTSTNELAPPSET